MINEIIVALVFGALGFCLGLAKHKKRSYIVRIPVSQDVSLGTLAPNTVTGTAITGASNTEAMWVVAATLSWTIINHTAGEGPLRFGLNHSDLSAAEIRECLDASPLGRGDIIANERARRPVRMAGSFPGLLSTESVNDGVPIKTKINLLIQHDKSLNFWIENRDGSNLTTGTVVKVDGFLWVRWMA